MTRLQWLALMLGLLLVAAPVIRAHGSHDDDDDDDEPDEAEPEEEGAVVVLTQDNFDDKIKSAKFALVEFYAPWCGHCKKLEPEYKKAAEALKEYDPSIIIGKVDATVHAELGKAHGVSGYPTLKWFINGEPTAYNGPRDAPGIIAWVKKRTGPAAYPLADKAALATAEKENEIIVVGYFKALEGDEYDGFIGAGQKNEDAVFFETTDAAIAKAAGIAAAPGVVVITNFEGEPRVVTPLAKDEKIRMETVNALVDKEKMPPTIEFNDKNGQKVFKSGIPLQLLLVSKAAHLERTSPVFKAFRKAADDFKGKFVFVTVDLDGGQADPVVNFFGLSKEAEEPVLLGFSTEGNKKYKCPGEKITEAAIKEFAQDLLDGKIKPDLKSAPEPDEPTDGGVTVVVGKTVETIAQDEAKDVLLEVYAPWCGHCKSLEPIYKKLAKRFKKVESVVIAKMDGTANEHPDIQVTGFPTILFFPAEKGAAPITFQGGDRSLKALTKFIKQHAKIPFELPKKKKDDAEKEEEKDEEKDEL